TVTGLPGASVEDVTLRGMRFVYPGGGTAADAKRPMPEVPASYPDPDIFGTTSAWGLYMHHVRDIILSDIELSTLAAESRPAVAMADVTGLRADNVLAATGRGTMLKPVKL
ncbi:MAG TPA: hypothetical protein VIJ72_03885, partial [Rhizomicrobium sp.]